jgi:hypothetical protein
MADGRLLEFDGETRGTERTLGLGRMSTQALFELRKAWVHVCRVKGHPKAVIVFPKDVAKVSRRDASAPGDAGRGSAAESPSGLAEQSGGTGSRSSGIDLEGIDPAVTMKAYSLLLWQGAHRRSVRGAREKRS